MFTTKCSIFLLFVAITFVATGAEKEPGYKKPFKVSCVSKPNQTEFKFFSLQEGFEKSIRSEDLLHEFRENSTFLFHFTGYGDILNMDKPRKTFYLARGILKAQLAERFAQEPVVCYVDYAYGNNGTICRVMRYNNAIRNRVPFVVDLLTVFVKKLTELHIIESMDQITASGFCLGGHMAGLFGRTLSSEFEHKIRMILAFDPPKYGFGKGKDMFTQRVQKGDAKYVEITHSSKTGMKTYDGDTDVILNNLHQPDCENETFPTFCNHLASLLLHEIIFNHTTPARFFATSDKTQMGKKDVLIGFYNTDYVGKGVVYLNTGATRLYRSFDNFHKE